MDKFIGEFLYVHMLAFQYYWTGNLEHTLHGQKFSVRF